MSGPSGFDRTLSRLARRGRCPGRPAARHRRRRRRGTPYPARPTPPSSHHEVASHDHELRGVAAARPTPTPGPARPDRGPRRPHPARPGARRRRAAIRGQPGAGRSGPERTHRVRLGRRHLGRGPGQRLCRASADHDHGPEEQPGMVPGRRPHRLLEQRRRDELDRHHGCAGHRPPDGDEAGRPRPAPRRHPQLVARREDDRGRGRARLRVQRVHRRTDRRCQEVPGLRAGAILVPGRQPGRLGFAQRRIPTSSASRAPRTGRVPAALHAGTAN